MNQPKNRLKHLIKKESFFATCDRDELGHCKEGTGDHSGSAPEAGKPDNKLPKNDAGVSDDDYKKMQPDWNKFADAKERTKVKNAVKGYAHQDYLRINDALRSGDETSWTTGNEQVEIRLMDKAFHKAAHVLEKDVTVFRGIEDLTDWDFPVGSLFTDRGFVSTSLNRDIAKSFKFDGVMLKITIPKGHKVLQPPEGPEEMEMILNRKSSFKVTGKDKDGHITLELQK